MKKAKSGKKEDSILEILKRLTKRMEEATIDIHEMKRDYKFINLRLGNVESNTEITKVDVEKIRQQLDETEKKLHKRLSTVGDLITVGLTNKYLSLDKRVSQLEKDHSRVQ